MDQTSIDIDALNKSFYDLFKITEKQQITINVNITNNSTINNDNSATNNHDNRVTNNVELRKCTYCKRFKSVDQYRSRIKIGLTKTCMDCRNFKKDADDRKRDRIKENFINTEVEKTCIRCGKVKQKDEFISLINGCETKVCSKCRTIDTCSSTCEHNITRRNCWICNPIGNFVNLYRVELGRIINNYYSEKYTHEQLCCNRKTLIDHIESQFTEQMNWGNYKVYWEMDHILPLMEIIEGEYIPKDEIIKRMHYSNIRPLSIAENKTKGNRNLTPDDAE